MDSGNKPISLLVVSDPINDARFTKMLAYMQAYGGVRIEDMPILVGESTKIRGRYFDEVIIDDLFADVAYTSDFYEDDRPSSAPANLPSHNWNYLKLRKGKY